MRRLEENSFLVLLVVASLLFCAIVLPFSGAILWALVASMLFMPLNDRLVRLTRRPNLAAGLSLLAILATVIVPAFLLGSALVGELAGLIVRIREGDIDLIGTLERMRDALPYWLRRTLGVDRLTTARATQAWIAGHFSGSLQVIAGRLLEFGTSAFGYLVSVGVMLYLSFFMLRDGRRVIASVETAMPLRLDQGREVFSRFLSVVRATIKGSLIVAIAQGTVGGLVFWVVGVTPALLWGVAMAFMSLLPAIGTGLIWVPVAIYLLATGAIWQGLFVVFCGLFVIGMVDNLLRPILVGREARMPDYLAFVSTLGGLQLFGFNGFILGPAAAALFLSVWELYVRDRAAEMAAEA
jgi:predicted PurR-regulated permease PerM